MTEIITSLKPLLIDLYTHIYIYGKGIDNLKVLRSMEEVAFVHSA